MHHHRAEYWIGVLGTARVIKRKETYLVTENQSTYIPVGEVHALENPGAIPLKNLLKFNRMVIPGEDDVVRFEDQYGRA
jgi:mannose-1-phosphate guanylyltransferase